MLDFERSTFRLENIGNWLLLPAPVKVTRSGMLFRMPCSFRAWPTRNLLWPFMDDAFGSRTFTNLPPCLTGFIIYLLDFLICGEAQCTWNVDFGVPEGKGLKNFSDLTMVMSLIVLFCRAYSAASDEGWTAGVLLLPWEQLILSLSQSTCLIFYTSSHQRTEANIISCSKRNVTPESRTMPKQHTRAGHV